MTWSLLEIRICVPLEEVRQNTECCFFVNVKTFSSSAHQQCELKEVCKNFATCNCLLIRVLRDRGTSEVAEFNPTVPDFDDLIRVLRWTAANGVCTGSDDMEVHMTG